MPPVTTIRTIFGIDLRTLALFRVCLGLWLVADLINRAGHLVAHYTDFGVFPRAVAVAYLSDWRLSIHFINGSAWFQAMLFIIAGLFALSLVLGYRTRLVTVVSWFLLLSLQNRNPILLQGGDNLALMLLFWGAFLPLGARFSVDAAMNDSTEDVPNKYFSVATMALLIQCMSVYFFSAFLKSGVEWIPDGTAVYYALHAEAFATPLGIWFRQFDTLMRGLTYFVWWLEAIGPLIMFAPVWHLPLRLLTIFLLIAMHVGFMFFLDVGLFPFISITSLLAFTPTWVWDKLGALARTPERLGVRMYYDGDCGFCRKTCLLIRTFLLLPETPVAPAQEVEEIHRVMAERDSWVVVDHDGERYVRWRAVALAFRRSALLWPLGYLFDLAALRPLGDRIYGFVAKHRRGFLGDWTATMLPYRPVAVAPSAGASIVVGLFMILVLFKNVSTIPSVRYEVPDVLVSVSAGLRLDQIWAMFAPSPIKVDGWYVIRGQLRDGTVVDVYNRAEGEPSWGKPTYIAQTYSDYRWRKYLSRMRKKRNERLLLHYGRYLCRSWNKGTPAEKQLMTYKVHFNSQRTLPDYQEREIKRRMIWRHDCFKKS